MPHRFWILHGYEHVEDNIILYFVQKTSFQKETNILSILCFSKHMTKQQKQNMKVCLGMATMATATKQ